MNRENCPAFGKECFVCHKTNHFGKVCERRDTRANYIRVAGETSGSESSADEESDTDYYTDEDVSQHSAVNSMDFRWGRFHRLPR